MLFTTAINLKVMLPTYLLTVKKKPDSRYFKLTYF